VTKKGSGPRDHRSEPDGEGGSARFRVDRVYVMPRSAHATAAPRPAATTPPAKRPTTPLALDSSQLPTASRTDTETELSLRRQLSRLQHQLAEAQRELAHKDEEVAAVVEKRLEIQAAYDVLLAQQRETQQTLADADDVRARMAGIEDRLAAATAEADELRHQLDRERTERATLAAQFDEANAAFDRARNLWRDETTLIDEQHATQLAHLDQQKRTALEAAESAKTAALERQHEAHEAELEALRATHERALAALRGELEPKVAEARDLTAELEQLTSQIAALEAEHQNLMTERIELHKWELQQQAEAHAAELATHTRTRAAELSRLTEELAAAKQACELSDRNAALREQLWEQTVNALRESQKKLQHELAEAKEQAAQAETDRASLDQRLATAQQRREALEADLRSMRERLDVSEQDARRAVIDRERFAAYLEQGLAMVGAMPEPVTDSLLDAKPAHAAPSSAAEPRAPITPAREPTASRREPTTPPRDRFAPDLVPGAIRHATAHERPTAQFLAIAEPPDVELEIEAEAPPLPDPREPTRH